MLVLIVLMSYAIGLLFYLFVEIQERAFMERTPLRSLENFESFVNNYDLRDNTNNRNALTMIYYSLTTLSTVGFGDYSPVTSGERCFITGVFLMMLIVFSTIINML